MIKAIIFDFDGVLVSSEGSRFEAIKQSAAKSHVIIADETFPDLVGKTTKTFLQEVLPDTEKQYLNAIIDDFEHAYKSKLEFFVSPITSTSSFIKHYQGPVMFAVASMSSRKMIDKVLHHFDLYTNMKVIVSRDDVSWYKPHPEVYLKTLQQLGISAQDAIVIEDSPVGAEAAIQAGIPCYILLNGMNKESDFKEKKISGFLRTTGDIKKLLS